MKTRIYSVFPMACFFSIYIIGVQTYNCLVSLGSDHKWYNDGYSVNCRMDSEAGSRPRLCVKYKTASHLGQIFRDCDHVYEKFFGYNIFRSDLGLGCRLFSTKTPDGGYEEGMYCYCYGDNCNSGDVPYPARNTTAELLVCRENLSRTISCSYGTINILYAMYGRLSATVCPLSQMSFTNCSLDISPLVTKSCQGKTQCKIMYGRNFAGTDPCPGVTKYTRVVYDCNWNV